MTGGVHQCLQNTSAAENPRFWARLAIAWHWLRPAESFNVLKSPQKSSTLIEAKSKNYRVKAQFYGTKVDTVGRILDFGGQASYVLICNQTVVGSNPTAGSL